MLLLYCIGEGGEKRQQQPPEQKNMYLYIVAVLDIYLQGGKMYFSKFVRWGSCNSGKMLSKTH